MKDIGDTLLTKTYQTMTTRFKVIDDLHKDIYAKRRKWKDADGDFVLRSCETSDERHCSQENEKKGNK